MLVLHMNLYVVLDGCSVITQVAFEGFFCCVTYCKVFVQLILEVEALSTGRTNMLFLINVHTYNVRINFLLCDSLETTYLTFVRLVPDVLKSHVFRKQMFRLPNIVTPTLVTRYFLR